MLMMRRLALALGLPCAAPSLARASRREGPKVKFHDVGVGAQSSGVQMESRRNAVATTAAATLEGQARRTSGRVKTKGVKMDWFLDCRCWLAVAAALAVATPPSVLALPKALTAAGNAGAVATPNPRAFDDNGVSTAQYRTLDQRVASFPCAHGSLFCPQSRSKRQEVAGKSAALSLFFCARCSHRTPLTLPSSFLQRSATSAPTWTSPCATGPRGTPPRGRPTCRAGRAARARCPTG